MLDGERVFCAAVDEELGRAGRVGSDEHAFENLERDAFHHGAVHECARVAFVGVHDEDLFGDLLCGEEGPLHSGGEAAASASAESGLFDGVDNFGGLHCGGFFESVETAVCLVFFNVAGDDASGETGHIERLFLSAFFGNCEASVFGESEDVFCCCVGSFDGGVEDGAVVGFNFDDRFGVAVTDAADSDDGDFARVSFKSLEDFPGSGGESAGCDSDFDAFDLSHVDQSIFLYSFRILTRFLRSSLPYTRPLMAMTGARLQQPRQATVWRENLPSLSVSPSFIPSSAVIHC